MERCAVITACMMISQLIRSMIRAKFNNMSPVALKKQRVCWSTIDIKNRFD